MRNIVLLETDKRGASIQTTTKGNTPPLTIFLEGFVSYGSRLISTG
jgi:hypothetical protein